MKLQRGDMASVYLKPGEMFLGTEPTLVSTLLGSCVAVTMFSPHDGFGAICHGLLPTCREKSLCDCDDELRYVDCAIRRMLESFAELGIAPAKLEVKVFGGSDMFQSDRPVTNSSITVGRQNIKVAQQMLEEQGLQISSIDVGGWRGRKILFFTHTGEVLLKRLNKPLASEQLPVT